MTDLHGMSLLPRRQLPHRLDLSAVLFYHPMTRRPISWFVALRCSTGFVLPTLRNSRNRMGQTPALGTSSIAFPHTAKSKFAKRFSPKTGTVMEGSKLGLQVWMIATYLVSTSLKSASSMKLHR